MLKTEAAAFLAGATQVEGAEASAPTNLHVISGEVLENSEEGKVKVDLGGLVFSPDDEQAIEIETLGGLEAGDTATILLAGQEGRGMVPLGIGGVGTTDRISSRVSSIEADYIKTAVLDAEKARIDTLEATKADITTLEADYATITSLTAATGRISDLEADHVSTTDLTAATGRIGQLEADTADIDTIRANAAKVQNLTAAQLEADHATIGSLDSTYATITNLTAATGRIGQLEADTADIDTIRANAAKVQNLTAAQLEADHATIGSLDTNYAHITNGVIDNAKIGYADVDDLAANYASINLANVNNAWITNGTIKDAAISNEMVANLSANKLTAGTINGSVINVTNLNADNITAGTINGQRIGEGSLSLSKLEDDVYTESEVDAKLATMQAEIDGAIETWTGTVVPTLNNAPASSWTTSAMRDTHVGDVYFVVNSQSEQNGYNYRFTKSGSTYSWQLIKDNDVTQALSRLQTAEGQIRTFNSDISSLKTDTGSLTTRTTELETRMTTAEGNIDLKVNTSTFNELSSTVDENSATITTLSTTTQTLRSDLDNLEIGGRNLILATGTAKTSAASASSSAYTSNYTLSDYGHELMNNVDDEWRVSFDYEIEGNESSNVNLYFQFRTTATTASVSGDIGVSGRCSKTFKLSSAQATSTAKTCRLRLQRATDGATFTITNLKLEKGNKATDWTPAPEDTEASITTISNTVNSVQQTATSNSSTISQLVTTLGTNADGTTKAGDIVHRTSAVEQDLSGFKTTVSNTYATQTDLSTTNGNVTNLTNRQTAYSATCSTAAGTAAKVAACTNFPTLAAGVTVTVRFSTANTATGALSLNVNSTGAKTIFVNGATTGTSNQLLWAANANITFTYDGTQWRVVSEPRTWYGTGGVAAATAAKTSTINEVVVCKGTTVVLNMTNENTNASATLNVTGTGARNIYYGTTTTRPTTENGYGWGAGSTVSLIFDGAYWRIGDTTSLSRLTAAESVISNHTTSIQQTSEAIALKADASDVYTKTQTDGLISTEVTNRNAAIQASADAINLSVSETYATKTVSNPNLSPYFNSIFGDTSYWYSASYPYKSSELGEVGTKLSDGWMHVEMDNSARTGAAYLNTWIRPQTWVKDSTTYTFLVEIRNLVLHAGTAIQPKPAESSAIAQTNVNAYINVSEDGAYYLTATTRADATTNSAYTTFSRGFILVAAGTNASFDYRLSVYEGVYSGPYKPYVDQTLSTRMTSAETAITQNADAIALRATKTEAYQVAQPNLSPFFESDPYRTATSYNGGYWQATADNWLMAGITQLTDGWAHLAIAKSKKIEIAIPRIESLKAGDKATLLFEWRDITVEGSPNLYGRAYPSNCQFALNSYNCSWTTSSSTSGTKYVVMTVNSTADGAQTWNAAINLAFNNGGSVSFTGDLRLSIYAGEYNGPYKPYSGNLLYASQAELKVTNDEISTKVSKDGVISSINQSAESITINANRVNIEGAAIFTGSGRLSETSLDDAYDSKGSANAVQQNLDNLRVGGRNLLRQSDDLTVCFSSKSGVTSVVGGYSDPDGGTGAYLITPSSTSWYAGTKSAYLLLTNLSVPYTFSIWLRADSATQCKLCCRYMDSTPYSSTATRRVFDVTTEWQRFYISAPLKQAQTTDSVWIGQVTTVPIYAYHPMVEISTKPSDWTPAPEDQTAYVDDSISGIEIGGRNLVGWTTKPTYIGRWNTALDPAAMTGWYRYSTAVTAELTDNGIKYTHDSSATNDGVVIPLASYDAMVGLESYIVSFKYRTNMTTFGTPYLLCSNKGTSGNIAHNGNIALTASETEWATYSETWTFPSTANKVTNALLLTYNTVNAGWIEIKNGSLKVETGTRATDWSPAPEDTSSAISAVQDNLNATRSWYAECASAADAVAKVATITPATTDFTTQTLVTPGTVVHVKFTNTNSGAAASLTLDINSTGAKPIRYIASGGNVAAIPGNGYLIAGRTYEFFYDGANWVVQMPYNSNTNYYDRENYKASVKASAAIAAARIAVFGTDGKLKLLGATAFDVTYPILYVATAYSADDVTAGTARTTNYTFWGTAFNLTSTHAITGAAAGVPVYIVGSIVGTTMTPTSAVLTCTEPTTENGYVYIRLGLMSTASNAVLESTHPMYAFLDGRFREVTPTEIVATQYIYRSCSMDVTSLDANTTWVSESGAVQNAWTTTRPPYDAGYPVIFVAQQKKRLDTTVTCTTPVRDQTTTIIDGRNIITGSINAEKINAEDLHVSAANIDGTISIGAIGEGAQALQTIIDTINQTLGQLQNSLSELDGVKQALTFDPQLGLVIASYDEDEDDDESFFTQQKGDSMTFNVLNSDTGTSTTLASLSGTNGFVANKMQAEQMIIGDWAWTEIGTDGFGLKYIGI